MDGVGKSFIASNLAALLAKASQRTILADMDVGGADLNILFGLFRPQYTLTDFLTKKVNTLEEVLIDIAHCLGLQLLPGTGDTLATTNPSYLAKQRLIRSLKQLDADVLVVDIGAGTNLHALDFFLMADTHIIVTNPEPAAIIDAYKFIKLAAIRKVLLYFNARSDIGKELLQRDFCSVEEILQVVNNINADAQTLAQQAISQFTPQLIANRASAKNGQVNILQLRKILKQYVGGELELLGEIPVDNNVEQSIRAYMPLVLHAPHSPASRALANIMPRLLDLAHREVA